MASHLITIIVPVRNNQDTIARCLKALGRQDYSNFEVIVVDNDSDYETKKIIKNFLNDKRFKYIAEMRIGRGAARQAGVETSRGEVIAMVDADCVPPNDWISKISRPIIDGEEK